MGNSESANHNDMLLNTNSIIVNKKKKQQSNDNDVLININSSIVNEKEKHQSNNNDAHYLAIEIRHATTYKQIVDIYSKYTPQSILDFYKTGVIEFYEKNDETAKILAKLIPKIPKEINNKLILIYYKNQIDICLMTIMANELDFGLVYNKKTWLFDATVSSKNIEYFIKLLQLPNINLNYQDINRMTFLYNIMLMQCKRRTIYYEDWISLFQCIEKGAYNFNLKDLCGNSVLTHILKERNANVLIEFAKLVCIDTYDIANECKWIEYIAYAPHYFRHNCLVFMLQRNDYIHLLYKMILNHHSSTYENAFIDIIIYFDKYDHSKTIEMINYKDGNNDTILHELSRRHCKKLLHFLTYYFDEIHVIKNNNGEYPMDIYKKSKVFMNRLENIMDNNTETWI